MREALELNAGYRFSDYNINAGSDNTWKLTANWDINDFVKVRGGRQVANRAPNIAELFSPAVFEVVTLDRPRSVLEPHACHLRQRGRRTPIARR